MSVAMRFGLLLVVLATIGCDRVTKHVATAALAGAPRQSFLGDTVRLGYAENTGGFLSLGASLPPAIRTVLFTVVTGFLLLAVIAYALRARWNVGRMFGLALFVGGGLSNWIDRVTRGSVVDFMNVGIGWLRTGVFNVADVAIMIGIGIFLLAELREHRKTLQ